LIRTEKKVEVDYGLSLIKEALDYGSEFNEAFSLNTLKVTNPLNIELKKGTSFSYLLTLK
jgi:hypothetical protein